MSNCCGPPTYAVSKSSLIMNAADSGFAPDMNNVTSLDGVSIGHVNPKAGCRVIGQPSSQIWGLVRILLFKIEHCILGNVVSLDYTLNMRAVDIKLQFVAQRK